MVGRAEGQALGALEEGAAVRGLTDTQLTSREALHSIKQILRVFQLVDHTSNLYYSFHKRYHCHQQH